MNPKIYTTNIAGKEVTATFSDLVLFAHGCVMLSCEDTVVLATACIGKDSKNNPGYFNLTVEYLEKHYASGKILGGQWNKREGRPSDQAVLASRMIDRTLRPLFPGHIKNAIQVIVTVLAVGKMDPKILAINAASLALGVSPIPFSGPVGAVSITAPKNGGEGNQNLDFKINNYLPTVTEATNDLDLVVCGHKNKICMIEALAFEYKNKDIVTALKLALTSISEMEKWQKEIVSEIGKEKLVFEDDKLPEDLKEDFTNLILPMLEKEIFGANSKQVILKTEEAWFEICNAKYPNDEKIKYIANAHLHKELDTLFHNGALVENKRPDLRKMDEVRQLFAKAGGISSMLHGTGIFYRGETHVLSVLTLDDPTSRLEVENIEALGKKRFLHHYNFPPYSVGETGRVGGMNRREMGHGFLVEKALLPVIPNYDAFPYTIRVVSESTSSNGSTSQASICASSIALMDGGVPIKRPVAGIAMGLMLDEKDEKNYKILTDIQGPEDHYGDMDFKISGTKEGVTAIQLDIKLSGVTVEILGEALEEAEKARLTILETITKEIAEPRENLSPNAPRIEMAKIEKEQIGQVIGPGGKAINSIRELTKTEISIEEDGRVFIFGFNDGPAKAKKIIEDMTHIYQIGDIVKDAEITRIADFGAFVKLSNTTEGLVHVSEIAPFRVNKVDTYLKIGMTVDVKVVKIDDGKIGVSIKALNPEMFKEIK